MSGRMSNERLAMLAGLAELPCTCGNYDCERYTSALTKDEVRELLAEVKRLRELEGSLTLEWGYRSRGERSATPAPSKEFAQDMAARRREVVAHRLRTDWINEES